MDNKYFFDLHIHTSWHSPCSAIVPDQLIPAARARGLDGIAITEHGYLWPREEIEQLKQAAGCPGFPVLAGCEISTQDGARRTGDLLVFGAAEIPSAPCTIAQLCREVHRQGGIVIAPHPLAEFVGLGEEIHAAPVDAIEVANHRHYAPAHTPRLEQVCRELDLPAVACSDSHAIDEIGLFCTEFDAPIHSEQELIEAIRAHRCQPQLKPPPQNWRQLFPGRK